MKQILKSVALVVFVLAIANSTGHAQIISSSTGSFSSNSVFNFLPAGSVEVYGVDFGAGAQTVDGGLYSFADDTNSVVLPGQTTTTTGSPFTAGTVTFNGNFLDNSANTDGSSFKVTGDAGLDQILNNGVYTESQTGTLTGLTVGTTYSVLALVADDRSYSVINGRTETFTDGTNSVGPQQYGFSTSSSTPVGGYFLETFTAQATTQEFDGATSAGGPQYQGILLVANAVPEPSTWALMLGGLGLLFLVPRRRSVS